MVFNWEWTGWAEPRVRGPVVIELSLWCDISVRLMKSVVSLMKDGSDIIGCSQMSTNWEMFSVTLLTLDTIGLIPMGFLCIFHRKYSWEVLCFLGGIQNSVMFLSSIPALWRCSSIRQISLLISVVESF